MTAVDHRPALGRTQVTPFTTDRRIVGTPAEVAAMVGRVRRSGRLIAMTTPRPTPEGAGNVSVTVRLLTTPVRSTRQVNTDRRCTVLRTTGRVAAITIPVAATVAALVWAVSRLVAELIHLMPYLGAALAVALLLWAGLGHAGVCPGLHCPGCSHGGH